MAQNIIEQLGISFSLQNNISLVFPPICMSSITTLFTCWMLTQYGNHCHAYKPRLYNSHWYQPWSQQFMWSSWAGKLKHGPQGELDLLMWQLCNLRSSPRRTLMGKFSLWIKWVDGLPGGERDRKERFRFLKKCNKTKTYHYNFAKKTISIDHLTSESGEKLKPTLTLFDIFIILLN